MNNDILTINADQLATVSGGLSPSEAKKTISAIARCDRDAEKNYFDQPINQGPCYKGALAKYK